MDAHHIWTKRYDADCWQIKRGDEVVGLILRHMDDRWSISDTMDRKMSPKRFSRPSAAIKFARDENLFCAPLES